MVLAISLGTFFAGFPACGAAAAVVIAGAAASGIRPRELLRGSRPLVLTLAVTGLIRSLGVPVPAVETAAETGTAGLSAVFHFLTALVTSAGFIESVRFSLGILVSFASGALFFSVTTMTELKDALTRGERAALRPLHIILKKMNLRGSGGPVEPGRTAPGRLALGIALMLGFLPRFFLIWEAANLAYNGRAGKRGITRLILLIPLVTERMIQTAAETALAMEARGLSL
jgi:biotin transport system permease protein